MAIDLELVVADDELIIRAGGSLVGIAIADLAARPEFASIGGIAPGDTDASAFGFTSNDPTLVGDRDTHLTTEQAVKGAIDNLGSIVTSDMTKVPVTSIGGITLINVDNLLATVGGGSFSDDSFAIYDNLDPTKIAKFQASGLPIGTATFILPPSADTLVGIGSAQTIYNKNIQFTSIFNSSGEVGGQLPMGYGPTNHDDLKTDIGFANAILGIFGHPSAPPSIMGLHSGGSSATKAQSGASAAILEISGRPILDTGDFSTVDHANLAFSVDGVAPTLAVHPTRIDFRVTPAASGTLTRSFVLGSDVGARLRGPLALMAGSTMAEARVGTALDILSGIHAHSKVSVALVNGVNDNIPLPTSSVVYITGPTGGFTIAGFAGGFEGAHLKVINLTTFAMTVGHEAATSTAANRISTMTTADRAGAGNGYAEFIYDSTTSRWINTNFQA
jgi:hypothetical protein